MENNSSSEYQKNGEFYSVDEEEERIQKVLENVDESDVMAALEAWKEFLSDNLSFPFDAKVYEIETRGPLRENDKVSVKKIVLVDDLYGIIVNLRLKRNSYDCPLCNLEIISKDSTNYQIVNDYNVWFVNR